MPARANPASSPLLRAIDEGRAEWEWTPITVGPLKLWVMRDALKVDGVRVAVTARDAQEVADLLDASLTTPKIEDLIWQRAALVLPPLTGDVVKTSAAEQSARIDAEIAKRGGDPGGIIATVGKSRCLSNKLRTGIACNYGWHTKSKASGGGPFASVSIPGVNVWQQPGFRHNADHADYSQNLRLVLRAAELGGKPVDLHDVLQDPKLAGLVSHEGVLRVLRQPLSDAVAASYPVPSSPSSPSSPPPASSKKRRGGGGAAGAVVLLLVGTVAIAAAKGST